MKKIFEKIQSYGEKAGQFREILETMPEKAAQVRDAVTMSAGQLHEIRKDVQATVAGLRTSNEGELTAALNEVRAGERELRRAGYELAGVEMELDPVQRLILLLDKVEDVRDSDLQSVLSANTHKQTLHGVLSSLVKAESIAEQFELGDLEYRRLRVNVGPLPALRLIWRRDEPVREPATVERSTPLAGEAKPTSRTTSVYQPGSMFARREPAATNTPREPATPVAPAETTPEPSTPVTTPDRSAAWSSGALDRFKKMPKLGGGGK